MFSVPSRRNTTEYHQNYRSLRGFRSKSSATFNVFGRTRFADSLPKLFTRTRRVNNVTPAAPRGVRSKLIPSRDMARRARDNDRTNERSQRYFATRTTPVVVLRFIISIKQNSPRALRARLSNSLSISHRVP